MLQGMSMMASVPALSPPPKSVTGLPVSFKEFSPLTTRPSGEDSVPRLSLHATSM